MTTFSANNLEDLNIEIGQEENDQQQPSFSKPVPGEDLLLKEEPQTAPAMDEAEPTVVEQLPMEDEGEVEHDLNGIAIGEQLGGVPSSSFSNDDKNDNDTIVESTDESAIAMMTASAPKPSKKSPCQSRRNKLFIGAAIAVLAIVALSAGFGMNKNRSTTNNASFVTALDEVDCEEVDSATETPTSYPTYTPSMAPVVTSSPTLPPAGSFSNDIALEVATSEDDGATRDRRLRLNKSVGGLRGSQQRNNRKLKCRK